MPVGPGKTGQPTTAVHLPELIKAIPQAASCIKKHLARLAGTAEMLAAPGTSTVESKHGPQGADLGRVLAQAAVELHDRRSFLVRLLLLVGEANERVFLSWSDSRLIRPKAIFRLP
jgi:hypothetical protein